MTAADKLRSRIKLMLVPCLGDLVSGVSGAVLLEVEGGGVMAVGRPDITVVHVAWVGTDGLNWVGFGAGLLSVSKTSGVSLRAMVGGVSMAETVVVAVIKVGDRRVMSCVWNEFNGCEVVGDRVESNWSRIK